MSVSSEHRCGALRRQRILVKAVAQGEGGRNYVTVIHSDLASLNCRSQNGLSACQYQLKCTLAALIVVTDFLLFCATAFTYCRWQQFRPAPQRARLA